MARINSTDDRLPQVLNKSREALALLFSTSMSRVDIGVDEDIVVVAYWVGDIARVDVKVRRDK